MGIFACISDESMQNEVGTPSRSTSKDQHQDHGKMMFAKSSVNRRNSNRWARWILYWRLQTAQNKNPIISICACWFDADVLLQRLFSQTTLLKEQVASIVDEEAKIRLFILITMGWNRMIFCALWKGYYYCELVIEHRCRNECLIKRVWFSISQPSKCPPSSTQARSNCKIKACC